MILGGLYLDSMMSDYIDATKILIVCFGVVNNKGAQVMMYSSI